MRILVIGDSAIDVFILTDSTRLSPESPVPIVVPYSVSSNPGMAGNVAANIQSLAPDAFVSALFPPHPSIKTRYVDRKTNHHFIRVDQDEGGEPLTVSAFSDAIKTPPDAVVISDYAKGFLNPDIMGSIAELCAANRIFCAADTKSLLGDWSKPINVVKINEVEFEANLKAGAEPWNKCRNLIVTRGDKGMCLYGQDGTIAYHSPGVEVEVSDLAGAGDSVLAALVVRYLEGKDLRAAMDYANKVGAVAVSKRGVVAVSREEVV